MLNFNIGQSQYLDQGFYIIIWLSLYVLSVHSLSPPKPAGLDPPIFLEIFFGIFFWKFFGNFFGIFFHENAERSGATSESI
jgi:hypothetical protein